MPTRIPNTDPPRTASVNNVPSPTPRPKIRGGKSAGAAAQLEVTDNFGFDRATNEWWFTVSVGDEVVYEHSGYRNERAAVADMTRYRLMAEQFVQRKIDDLKREQTRPYTVLVVSPQREIALQLIPFLRWRLGLKNDADAEFLNTVYGHRLPLGAVVDGIVYIHPAQAESDDPGILEKSAIPLRAGGWRAFIGGTPPWKNVRDLLLPQ